MDTEEEASNKREMIEGLKRTFIIVDDPVKNRDSLHSGSCKSLQTHNSFQTKSLAKFGNLSQKHKNNSFFSTRNPQNPKVGFPNELSSFNSSTLRNTQMPTLNKDQFLFLRDKLKAPLLYQKNFEVFPRNQNSQSRPPTTNPQTLLINTGKNIKKPENSKISANFKNIVFEGKTKMSPKLIAVGGVGSRQGTDRNASKIGSKNSVLPNPGKADGSKIFGAA
jgi:hypothetical protein